MKRTPTKVITIDRSSYVLTLWRENGKDLKDGFRATRKWPIAVGLKGYETPTGVYTIYGKWREPDWKKPDSPWVPEEERGKIIPGGSPENPLVGWFLALREDGIGIHGTHDIGSIGRNASHGCIRMSAKDIDDLAKRVEVGTIVVIVN